MWQGENGVFVSNYQSVKGKKGKKEPERVPVLPVT